MKFGQFTSYYKKKYDRKTWKPAPSPIVFAKNKAQPLLEN